jgi:hypothetical protein
MSWWQGGGSAFWGGALMRAFCDFSIPKSGLLWNSILKVDFSEMVL